MQKLIAWIYQRDCVKFILVFLFFALYLGLIYLTVDRFISLDDQFFHIRFAELIKEKGLGVFKDFKWLYFSRIAQEQTYFENYHFLFYLALLPFTLLNPLYLGIKWYGVIFGALAFALLYYFLRRVGERYAFFWTVLALAVFNIRLLLRFLNARPFTLAPALLLILLYLLYRRKYVWALVLSLLYFYWHSATFFFPLVVAGLYFLVRKITDKKTDWKLVLYPALGTGLAFISMVIFAPGFLQFMKDVTFSVVYRTIILGREKIIEGTELYPADYFTFIRPNVIILGLLVIALGFELYDFIRRRRTRGDEGGISPATGERTLRLTLLVMTLIFLIGTFLVRRNSDYFIFFSAAYLAMALNRLLISLKFDDRLLKRYLAGACVALIAFLLVDNLLLARFFIAQAKPHDLIENAALWLKNNTSKNEIVFNVSRDDFPTLFYYNQNNYYITGLEARLLYDYSPQLYWLWWHIATQANVCERPACVSSGELNDKAVLERRGQEIAQVILKVFQSQYIVSTYQFEKLNAVLNQSSVFQRVYEDPYYFIYRIRSGEKK